MSYLGDPVQDRMKFGVRCSCSPIWVDNTHWCGDTYWPNGVPWDFPKPLVPVTPNPLPWTVPTPSPTPIVWPSPPVETLPAKLVRRKDFDNPSGWLIVGHCHACGNPIYAQVGDTDSPPKSHRTCGCK